MKEDKYMEILVDARGKACPLPVIETRNALREHGAPVVTLVDNDIARQNVEKMAGQMGLLAQTQKEEGYWRITLTAAQDGDFDANRPEVDKLMEEMPSCTLPVQGPTVVVLSSDAMGVGDDTLGRALMKGFVYALTQLDEAPATVLLYNGGAKLSVEGAETVADLKTLEEAGAEILTCGTCLNHYGLTEKLAVGSVTNMYVIAETMAKAGKVVRP